MKERQYNIDFLRGMMIIFVMILHAIDLLLLENLIDQVVGKWLYTVIITFQIPIMFSISGYVSAYSSNDDQRLYKVIGKQFTSLYIPYLFINYLYWIERLIANNLLGISMHNPMRLSLRSILELLYIADSATWFLLAILLIRTVSIICRRYFPAILEPILFSFFVWLAYLGYGGKVTRYLSWGLFYTFGYLINIYKIDQNKSKTFKISLTIILLNIIAIGISNLLSRGIEGLNSCAKFLIGTVGFIILLIATRKIPQIKIINFCGKHSMIQFEVHCLSQFVTFYILVKFFTSPVVLIPMMVIVQIALAMTVYICYKKVKWLKWVEIIFYPYDYFHRKSNLKKVD